jgi:DNA-binding NtrC family response regulator
MDVARILIVDDEPIARENLDYVLRKDGYKTVVAEDGAQAIRQLEREPFELVMTDLRMQPVGGMEVLKRSKEISPETEVIVITGYATVSTAVEAMREGAFYYVPKPLNIDEVRILVRQALEKGALKREVTELRQLVRTQRESPLLIGASPQMAHLKKTIDQIAPTDCNVLILGETGTGKELVAKTVHRLSRRASQRFLAVNCGAFNEELLANELFGHEREAFTSARGVKKGLMEAVDQGTLFLDEIGDMPLAMQVKLLRVLQERVFMRVGGTQEIPVNIRLLAATNKDLKREVDAGSFRQDLYFRLNVITLTVPRLADRRDDILLLSRTFLRKFSDEQEKNVDTLSDGVLEILMAYEFPGNVRELENIIERAVALTTGARVEVQHLPQDLQEHSSEVQRHRGEFLTLEENEREYIAWVLDQVKDNRTKAAEILGIDRVSLWRKLKRYSMD